MAAILGLFGFALLALGIAWAASRLKPHERPYWDGRAFVALRETSGAPAAWRERWVVAVHPGCPHCRVSLGSLVAARDRAAGGVHVTALIVDVREAPADSVVAALPADETWWDSGGRWRRRWAHGVYGEVLCFDTEGRLARLLPPLADEEDARRRLTAAGIETRFD